MSGRPSRNAHDRAGPPDSAAAGLTWAVGILTAPRPVPTLARTLRSLDKAGFGTVHIFAEPGSVVPPEARSHRVEVHERRLGNFTNFYHALASLYRRESHAAAIALFQDDVEVAAGLRAWCDAQFWPSDCGLVSLFTPRVHEDVQPGWRLRSPGYHQIWGAQALVIRRELLERFLADPQILQEIRSGRHGDDALVSGWATSRQQPIAYHTPSLVQHFGHVSSLWAEGPHRRVFANAVDSVDLIETWKIPPRRPGKIGLVGRDGASGLGYQNRDLALNYDIDRWLIPGRPDPETPTSPIPHCRIDYVPQRLAALALRRWLKGLDWVLFVESPPIPRLVPMARDAGVSIALVPNWEWLHPRAEWLPFVDLMICPNAFSLLHVGDWKRRFGFGWEVSHVAWPVDTSRFRFRERRRCERFVFVNGRGGHHGVRLDGSKTPGRKGVELIVAAARAASSLEFLLYSQVGELPELPDNVQRRPPPTDHRLLYEEGDVCVQPSHCEGLGLPLLECQAAGMPLVTTDGPPMNELNPWATIPVIETEAVIYGSGYPIPWRRMSGEGLADLLLGLRWADISEASRRARAFIEAEHSWARARAALRQLLTVR